jgi:hypothetical protein
MIKKITLLFVVLCTSAVTSQSISISDSDLFNTTVNATWTHVFTAATTAQGVAITGLAQTVEINITSLPDNSTYRIYKTTSTGAADFSQQGDLAMGENTIVVSAVDFNRAVKFQFSGGGLIEFDSFSHNGVVLYPVAVQECTSDDVIIGTSDLFVSQEGDWPYYLAAASIDDDGTNMNTAHSFEMNITCMPAGGASYRIYKTNSAGNDITCCIGALSLGENSKTVAGVAWERNLRFQFSSPDIGFSSLSVNGADLLGLEDLNSNLFSIYPNPATDIISVSGVENINSIKVYSLLGTLEKEVFNTNQIDISELSTGVHLIEIDNGTVYSRKIIKQ